MLQVDFNILNQKGTPAFFADALANRPAAGFAGRIFVDTDVPSTGMYRDTGTAWELIASGGAPVLQDLQSVTTVGNTTNTGIVFDSNGASFQYPDQSGANGIGFFNQNTSTTEYSIYKRGTGIITNDILIIESTNNNFGISLDQSQSIIQTYFNLTTDIGLKLDFANWNFYLGDFNGVQNSAYIYCNNDTSPGVYAYSEGSSCMAIGYWTAVLGDWGFAQNGTIFNVNDINQIIKTKNNGNDIGLKLDFANNVFILGNPNVLAGIAGGIKVDTNNNATTIGDFNLSNNATTLFIDDNNRIIKSTYFYSDIGLKLDFASSIFYFGDYSSSSCCFVADNNLGFAQIMCAGYTNFQADGAGTFIGDNNSTGNATIFGVNDAGQTLYGSANLKSGTAGGSSGQHLKINIGGTNYKIALLNP